MGIVEVWLAPLSSFLDGCREIRKVIAMLCIKMFYRIFSFHFDSNLSHVRFLSFDEWLYVSTLLTYEQDEWPQTWNGNPKIRLENWLGSRRVEDAKGVNLNTILIKLKCENTHNTKWTVSNLRTQHSYVIFNSANLSPSV